MILTKDLAVRPAQSDWQPYLGEPENIFLTVILRHTVLHIYFFNNATSRGIIRGGGEGEIPRIIEKEKIKKGEKMGEKGEMR